MVAHPAAIKTLPQHIAGSMPQEIDIVESGVAEVTAADCRPPEPEKR